MKLVAASSLLKVNDLLAAENRRQLQDAGVFVINQKGSPGCGKTTLLEGLFPLLNSTNPAVIEGDIAGEVDALRLKKAGIPVVQINTDGACHLDANMVSAAMAEMDYTDCELLVIENVGNLVCTAGFDLGENLRLVCLSVPEGDDKIIKYPAIFQKSDLLCITKSDLYAHFDFDMDKVRSDYGALNPDAPIFEVSAKSGSGMAALAEFIDQQMVQK